MKKLLIGLFLLYSLLLGQSNTNISNVNNYNYLKFNKGDKVDIPYTGYFLASKLMLSYINLDVKYKNLMSDKDKYFGLYDVQKDLVESLKVDLDLLNIKFNKQGQLYEYEKEDNKLLIKLVERWKKHYKYRYIGYIVSFSIGVVIMGTAVYLSGQVF